MLETYIAQLELFTLLAAILLNAESLRGGNSLWFMDNVPVLMAIVNGTSATATLEHMARLAHLMLYVIKGQAYFEYVESDSNWVEVVTNPTSERIYSSAPDETGRRVVAHNTSRPSKPQPRRSPRQGFEVGAQELSRHVTSLQP